MITLTFASWWFPLMLTLGGLLVVTVWPTGGGFAGDFDGMMLGALWVVFALVVWLVWALLR